MAESGVILPPDSTGKAERTVTVTTTFTTGSGGVVHQPVVAAADSAGNLYTSLGMDTRRAFDVNLAASAGGMNLVTGTLSAAQPTVGSAVAGGTVQANVGNMGNGTIVLYGGTYTVLALFFEASIDNTNWFPIDVVRTDGTAVIAGTPEYFTAATAANNARAWNYMAPGYTQIRARASAFTATGNPTVAITQGPFLYDPSPSSPPMDGNKLTYSSALNNTGVAAAVTTSVPVWEFVNAGTRLVRITRIAWELTLATAGTVPLQQLIKRSAASTVGTAVAQTPGAHDTRAPATSCTVAYYTAAPTLGGSQLLVVRSHRVFGVATTMTAQPTLVEWLFGNRPAQALVLRPGESLSLQSSAAYATAPTITGSIEWTEENL